MELTQAEKDLKNKYSRDYYSKHKEQQKAYNRRYWANKLLKELTNKEE